MANKTVCKDCENRHQGCHSHCEEYKAFCAELEKERKARLYESDLRSYKNDGYYKYMKRTKWRIKK